MKTARWGCYTSHDARGRCHNALFCFCRFGESVCTVCEDTLGSLSNRNRNPYCGEISPGDRASRMRFRVIAFPHEISQYVAVRSPQMCPILRTTRPGRSLPSCFNALCRSHFTYCVLQVFAKLPHVNTQPQNFSSFLQTCNNGGKTKYCGFGGRLSAH